MIRCKLVEYISPDATQVLARVGRAVSGPSLQIGRAAASRIYLPDPRVRLEHATIRRADNGALYLDAAGPVEVDGESVTSIRLAIGQRIAIGPYDLRVEEIDCSANQAAARMTLAFALRAPEPGGHTADPLALGRDGLKPGWLTRRRLAWVLALALLAVGLLLPGWQALQPGERPIGGAAPAPASGESNRLDDLWNPGPIASAHQTFADDCRACHEQAFVRVVDAACVGCHERTGDHVADAALNRSAMRGQRCAGCHREHQGALGMQLVDSLGCAQCHAAIDEFAPQSKLEKISDFADGHPDFRLSILRGEPWPPAIGSQPAAVSQRGAGRAGPPEVVRVQQTAALRDDPGLKYPHDVHLAKEGVKSPDGPVATGGRVVLDCDDCHRPDAAGAGFEPIRMARDCQGCHRLAVDPQAPDRQVPHASPPAVAVAVREIYAALAVERFPLEVLTVNALLQRPGGRAGSERRSSAESWVQAQSAAAMAALFAEKKGVCTTCHSIAERGASPAEWQVRPIVLTRDWLPKSLFSHTQHRNAKCGDCHDARTSKAADDILIPTIAGCRDCHGGEKPGPDRLRSRCDDCHVFHGATPHPLFAAKAEAGEKHR